MTTNAKSLLRELAETLGELHQFARNEQAKDPKRHLLSPAADTHITALIDEGLRQANVLDASDQVSGQFERQRRMVQSTKLGGMADDQRAAVAAFRDANGRDWKEGLGSLWMTGNYSRRGIDKDQAALLQQVRNQFGPEWLENVTRADLDQDDSNTVRLRG